MIKRYIAAALVIFAFCCMFVDGNTESIENVDYAVAISILSEGGEEDDATDKVVKIRLYVANLMEYRGSSEQMLETDCYVYEVEEISDVTELYKEETGRTLSLEHIKKITVEENPEADKWSTQVLLELTGYVDMTDEVKVEIAGESVGYRSLVVRRQ
jgi:hypothetical protein